MARPREFDVDAALADAMTTFWQRGYDGTSLRDLVAATGVQKASLYATFGDKHQLVLTALERYQDRGHDQLAALLAAAGSPLQGLEAMIREAARAAGSKAGQRGCMCTNACVELAPHDPAVAAVVRRHVRRVQRLLADTARRAQQLGQLPEGRDAEQLGAFLYGSLVAISVLGKARPGKASLAGVAEQTVRALHA